MDLSLIIPTYNEKENIQKLLEEINKEFEDNGINGEVIVVDDGSPDGTGEILEKLKEKYSCLKVIHRKGKLGLSSAVLEGFKIGEGNILGVMDADLSHPPEKIKELFWAIEKGEADFVIGSRYVNGGKIVGWSVKRKMMSKVATVLAKPFTHVKDPMTGFFMIKKKCIEGKKLNSKGFKILLEIIIKGDYNKIKEVPIIFVDRTKGKSKATNKEIFFYLKNLFGYLFYKKVIGEFFKFALVGLLGTILNLLVLYSLTEFLNVYYMFSAIVAFIIAATHNFILNKIWTFKENIRDRVTSKYMKFFSVSVVALLVNLLFLRIFTESLGLYYMVSQILAIGIALIINFLGNKMWTFKK
jgi:dolichol-phosphate mannosyltransferase